MQLHCFVGPLAFAWLILGGCSSETSTGEDPCAGLACGATCTGSCSAEAGCPDVEFFCNEVGQCTSDAAPACETPDPCEGKACGDSCTAPCPDGKNCPDVESYCNAEGSCSTDAMPLCP